MTDVLDPRYTITGAHTTEELLRASAQGADVPHRIAAYRESPYYHPVWSPRVKEVRWNGVALKDVVEFDADAGWADQMVRSPMDRSEVLIAGIAYPRRRHGKIDVDFRIPV